MHLILNYAHVDPQVCQVVLRLRYSDYNLIRILSIPMRATFRVNLIPLNHSKLKTKLHGLGPRANYTDLATAAYRRSNCQLLRIEGDTWSA
jgi:hypothetical protein